MPAEFTTHISKMGFDMDDDGFSWVECGCGTVLGPAPDQETLLDMAMEHAYWAGREEAKARA